MHYDEQYWHAENMRDAELDARVSELITEHNVGAVLDRIHAHMMQDDVVKSLDRGEQADWIAARQQVDDAAMSVAGL